MTPAFSSARLLIATSLLVVLLCAMGWLAAVEGSTDVALGLAVAAVSVPAGYGLIRALGFAMRKLDSRDFFSPLIAFPIAYIFWFTFGTVDFLEDPWHALYGMFDPMPPVMWLYSTVGLAGYIAGVLLIKKGFTWFPEQPASALVQNGWRPSPSRAGLYFLVALMLGTYLVIVGQIGLPVLSATAAETRLDVAALGSVQAVFLCSAWTVMAFLLAGYAARRWSGKAVMVGVALTSVLLLSLGGRGNFFIGFLALLIAWNYLKRGIRIQTLGAAVVILFIAMSSYGFVRDLAFGGGDSFGYLDAVGIPAPVQPLVYAFTYIRGGIATFRDVTALIPSEIPYQHGRLTLLPLSSLLPGHHEMTDMYFKKILGHDFVGLGQPATPLGPLYADFGLPGIFAGMFGFGLLAGGLYGRMRRRPTVARVLVYAWVMQVALLGLFASLFPYISTLFVPLFWVAVDRFFSLTPPRIGDCTCPAELRGRNLCSPQSLPPSTV
jgi:oligosaccharide repeat unit polymerase